jgi:hypothetical protein
VPYLTDLKATAIRGEDGRFARSAAVLFTLSGVSDRVVVAVFVSRGGSHGKHGTRFLIQGASRCHEIGMLP